MERQDGNAHAVVGRRRVAVRPVPGIELGTTAIVALVLTLKGGRVDVANVGHSCCVLHRDGQEPLTLAVTINQHFLEKP
jgi:hypothetical protein